MNSAFETVLDHALSFSRIHGWVVQLEDEIRAVRAFFQEENPDRSAYEEILLDRLGLVTSLEEKLLLLVLLRYLEIPLPRIAELFLTHLDGKLGKTERAFLNRHFFGGPSPIPLSISKEITDREFLNYQRAIYNALQISRFDSDFDADHVVLALVHLLCLSGLLAPNRAMILLLLSRIDAELSPGLESMVKNSMHQLESVIREVESRRESVLKDSMEPDLRSETAYDWKAPAPNSAATPRSARTIKLDTATSEPPHDWSELRNSLKAPVTGGESPFSKDYFTRSEAQDQVPGHDYSGMLGKPASAPGKNADAYTDRSQPPDQPAAPEWEPFTASPAMEKIHSEKDKPAPLQNREVEDHRRWAPASPEEPPPQAAAAPRYTILFNRVTNELQAVIHSLEEAKNQSPDANAPGAVPEGETKAVIFRLPRAFWVTGALLLLLFLFFVIIRCGTGPQAAGAQSELLVPQGTANTSPSPAQPPTTASISPAVSPTAQTISASPALDPSLRQMDGHIFWRVRVYDTLWKLYLKIQNGQLSFDGSSALAPQPWDTFLQTIQGLNPQLTNPDRLLPRQLIRLS